MEHTLRPTQNIQPQEVTKLLETFWGVGNPIASVSGEVRNFDSAQALFRDAESLGSKQDKRQYILDNLDGKKISLGIRDGEDLVAHSGLTVKSWGEVECSSSIVLQEHRDKLLTRGLNEGRKTLLREFASLDFLLTGYVVLGANSVYYGAHLFDFEDLGMGSYFCNIGPYVYNRPIGVTEKDSAKLAALSLHTDTLSISSSAQAIGIRKDEPPKIAQGLAAEMTVPMRDFLSGFPYVEENMSSQTPEIKNVVHYSPAKIAIHVLREPFEDGHSFLSDLSQDIKEGNNTIVQIPLQSGAEKVVKQITDVIGKESAGVVLIPTGMTVIDGYWAMTFASVVKARLPHYKYMLETLLKEYDIDSLKKLVAYSLKIVNSLQEETSIFNNETNK